MELNISSQMPTKTGTGNVVYNQKSASNRSMAAHSRLFGRMLITMLFHCD